MKLKSILFKSIILLLTLSLNSCSSDSNTEDEVIIIVNTSNFSTSINENPTNGQVLGTIQGSTNQGSVTFSIIEQNPIGALAIDSSTGELVVSNGSLFNFGSNPMITGTVKVANGSVFENATITITVNETIITVSTSDFSISMDENPSLGQVIGTVEGITNQGEVSFSISEQTPNGALEINTVSGELLVADLTAFNYEANTNITAIVKVENGAVYENASINIEIIDVLESAICEGTVSLTTQEEVDAFGLLGCSTINGFLVIGPPVDDSNNSIVDLSPLAGITTVNGWIMVRGNLSLTNIDALSSINTVTGGLQIESNPMLESLHGFQGLSEIGGPTILIDNNDSLTNLEGFDNFISFSGLFIIGGNSSIENLSGLENFQELNSIDIAGNENLENIDALNNLTTITGQFKIDSNQSLINIAGLHNVTQIESLIIDRSDLLISLDGIQNVTTLRSIRIHDNEMLNDISQLYSITSLEGDFDISANQSLENFEGLNNLEYIGGTMIIISNNNLIQINALSNLTTIEGDYILISNNENLIDLNGLANANMTYFGAVVRILSNTQLTDLCGLTFLILNSDIIQYQVEGNLYNPTEQDIIDGNCSL